MRDVLLITVDSLRTDRMGFLGCDRNTTPNIDSLASDSLVYQQAQAHGPTHSVLFHRYSPAHTYQTTEYPELSGETIAECTRDAGYHTASVTSNAWVSPTYNYDRDFDTVHSLGRGPHSATGPWDRLRHRVGDLLGDGVFSISQSKVPSTARDGGKPPRPKTGFSTTSSNTPSVTNRRLPGHTT